MKRDLPEEMKQAAELILLERQRRLFVRNFDPSELPKWYRSKLDFAAKASQVAVVKSLRQEHFAGRESVSLLDIGCGFGTYVISCLEEGIDAYGVDIAPGEIEFARQRLEYASGSSSDDRFLVQSGTQLPFAGASFDVATLWSVVEHVQDWRRMLDEVVRVLKPGGLLLINSPNYWGVWIEPHYEVFWPPLFNLLPGKWIAAYLRLRGYNPRPFEVGLNLIGLPTMVGQLKRRGLKPFYGNALLFRGKPVYRRLTRFLPAGMVDCLYRWYCAFPLRRNLFIMAKKPACS